MAVCFHLPAHLFGRFISSSLLDFRPSLVVTACSLPSPPSLPLRCPPISLCSRSSVWFWWCGADPAGSDGTRALAPCCRSPYPHDSSPPAACQPAAGTGAVPQSQSQSQSQGGGLTPVCGLADTRWRRALPPLCMRLSLAPAGGEPSGTLTPATGQSSRLQTHCVFGCGVTDVVYRRGGMGGANAAA